MPFLNYKFRNGVENEKKLCIFLIFILIIEYSFCMPCPRIAFYIESFTEQKVVI